ncbi:hypothetical protein ABW20_dc0108830 [Dactylellina cionopaga]|nr:hypothetical protein ABW20_dc0108830 [Dactylellina cionopaga]
MWDNGDTVTCSFSTNPNMEWNQQRPLTPKVRHLIEHFAHIWERWANIKFKFVEDDSADIIITTMINKDNREDKHYKRRGEGTLNFGWFTDDTDVEEFSRTAIHEFGHALGCQHEQLNLNRTIRWKKDALYIYYAGFGWTHDQVDFNYNYWEPPSDTETYSSKWDGESIMHYSVKKEWNYDNKEIVQSNQLSPGDKDWIGKRYPFPCSPASSPAADLLAENSAFAGVHVYEYKAGKMYMNLFCQSESSALYKLTYLYKHGSPTRLYPNWDVERINLPLSGPDAPAPGTPLAAIKNGHGLEPPNLHLFYLDREDNVREVVWNGRVLKCKNKLDIKAASYSKLSAIAWSMGDHQTQIRLMYQSETGKIQQRRGDFTWNKGGNTGTTIWSKAYHLEFAEAPSMPGTSLSFVNQYHDKAVVRGYFQTTSGAIRELSFEGSGDWKLTDLNITDAHYATSMAAEVFQFASPRPTVILYYIGRERTDIDQYLVMRHMPGLSEASVCKENVNKGSGLGLVNCPDIGRFVFASDKHNIVQRVAEGAEGTNRSWSAPTPIELSASSVLGFGSSSSSGGGGGGGGGDSGGDSGGIIGP